MNRRRWFLLVGIVFLLAVSALFLRDVIYQTIILPLAYLWWVFRFYYSLIPQLFLWTLLMIVMFVIVLFNFVPAARPSRRREHKRRVAQGPVEALAASLISARQGSYFKWQTANRLARIARGVREISEWRDHSKARNEAVEKYLDAGVNTSFVDYPRRANPFQRPVPTVLDLDPKEAVDYLESQFGE